MATKLPPALARLRAHILRRIQRMMRKHPDEIRRQIDELYADDTCADVGANTALPEALPNGGLTAMREEAAMRTDLRTLCNGCGVVLHTDSRGGAA